MQVASSSTLGALQVGDFFQLPPISKAGQQSRRMLFDSPLFQSADIKKIKLQQVFRQQDSRLLDLLHAARYGRLQQQHVDYMTSLDRPITDSGTGLKPTKLYPVNTLVDEENKLRLLDSDCSGPVHIYKAKDVGGSADLEQLTRNCMAAQTLELRLGAQVCYCLPATSCRLPDSKVAGCQEQFACRYYTW